MIQAIGASSIILADEARSWDALHDRYTAAALNAPVSRQWKGYWQRQLAKPMSAKSWTFRLP